MQRTQLVAISLVALAACVSTPSAPDAPRRRTLVTDNIGWRTSRGNVRAWMDTHDWYAAREYRNTDEFVFAGRVASRAPRLRVMLRDHGDGVDCIALFVPVPTNGDHDPIQIGLSPISSKPEHGLIDGDGLVDDLAGAGWAAWPTPPTVRGNVRRMLDQLKASWRSATASRVAKTPPIPR